MPEIEILVVNDGSTDDSEAIIRQWQERDPRITYYNQPNRGQSAARNLALQHVRGEYIYFMDSDDIIDRDTLRCCYEYAQQTQCDFCFFDGDTILNEGAEPLLWDYRRTHLLNEHTRYDGEHLLRMMLDNGKHSCVVWLLFIRTEFFQKLGLRFYDGIIHEDELFTTILTLSSHNIYCLQRSLVKHRVRRASTMGKSYSKRNVNCYLTVIDELLRFRRTPIIHQFARYTLSRVFYTAHAIPLRQKPAVFWRAVRSGYLKYIGWKTTTVFWLKH